MDGSRLCEVRHVQLKRSASHGPNDPRTAKAAQTKTARTLLTRGTLKWNATRDLDGASQTIKVRCSYAEENTRNWGLRQEQTSTAHLAGCATDDPTRRRGFGGKHKGCCVRTADRTQHRINFRQIEDHCQEPDHCRGSRSPLLGRRSPSRTREITCNTPRSSPTVRLTGPTQPSSSRSGKSSSQRHLWIADICRRGSALA